MSVNINGACRMINDGEAYTRCIPGVSNLWQNKSKPRCSFFVKDNINMLISKSDIFNEVNLLSVKLASNDCWRREAFDAVQPVLPLAMIGL